MAEAPPCGVDATPPKLSPAIDVFWDERMLEYEPLSGVFDSGFNPGFLDVLDKHPENPDRIKNMVSILRRGPLSPQISWHPGRPAKILELCSFHTPEYIEELVVANSDGGRKLCEGTFLNPRSWEAALIAAGTTLSAMKHLLEGKGKVAYALVRPPGHHAQPSRADGYCFLNNAGLAAQLALASGCERVTMIDVDVHYGNGTAEGFYASDQAGSVEEVGTGEGFGYNLNIPLPNGSGNSGYAYAMAELVVPAVRKFNPSIVVLVLGQDSSAFDPNGRQCLTMEGYRMIGGVVRSLAEECASGKLLLVQEGGYHLTYAAYCLHATLEGVLGVEGAPILADPIAYYPEDDAQAVEVVDSIARRWRSIMLPLFRDA